MREEIKKWYEILDTILEYMVKSEITDEEPMPRNVILNNLRLLDVLNLRQRHIVFEKLERDNYVMKKFDPDNPNQGLVCYYITFEGEVFSLSGGYLKNFQAEAVKQNLQSSQTWAIVVGTVLAGLGGLTLIYHWVVKIAEFFNCHLL